MATSPAAPTPETPWVSLECTSETFVPVLDPRVRWLDEEADFALAREAWEARGVPMTLADWGEAHGRGFRYCGIVEDERLVAVAAAWTYSPTAWELAAVQTREGYSSRGYSKAVCSFATAHILASGRKATCHTRADNAPMLRVARSLGFQPLSDS
jgi:GNAT superfamily N-acetyltransferase